MSETTGRAQPPPLLGKPPIFDHHELEKVEREARQRAIATTKEKKANAAAVAVAAAAAAAAAAADAQQLELDHATDNQNGSLDGSQIDIGCDGMLFDDEDDDEDDNKSQCVQSTEEVAPVHGPGGPAAHADLFATVATLCSVVQNSATTSKVAKQLACKITSMMQEMATMGTGGVAAVVPVPSSFATPTNSLDAIPQQVAAKCVPFAGGIAAWRRNLLRGVLPNITGDDRERCLILYKNTAFDGQGMVLTLDASKHLCTICSSYEVKGFCPGNDVNNSAAQCHFRYCEHCEPRASPTACVAKHTSADRKCDGGCRGGVAFSATVWFRVVCPDGPARTTKLPIFVCPPCAHGQLSFNHSAANLTVEFATTSRKKVVTCDVCGHGPGERVDTLVTCVEPACGHVVHAGCLAPGSQADIPVLILPAADEVAMRCSHHPNKTTASLQPFYGVQNIVDGHCGAAASSSGDNQGTGKRKRPADNQGKRPAGPH